MSNDTERRARPTVVGTVISAKMQDTIVVRQDRKVKHPLYGKYVKRATKFVAHDAGNACNEGDVVEIGQTRPLSKTKCWRLLRIVRRGPEIIDAKAARAASAAEEDES